MMKTYKKRTPTYKAIFIQGAKTENGYKLLTPDEDINAFAKYIQMDWSWDAEHGEVKFFIPMSKGIGIPAYSIMIGYYVVSDGTPKALRIYDGAAFEQSFEKVDRLYGPTIYR